MKGLRKETVRDYLWIILGSFLIGYAIKNVFDPAEMVTGGVSGFAVIFNRLFSIPLWVTNTVMNIPLFIVTYLIKGWKFMVRTLVSTAVLSLALWVIPERPLIAENDPLLSALFGGIITGIGTGFVFMSRATTGGTDMLAADIQHFMRHRSVAQILMVLDGLVVLLGASIFGVNAALYAVIAVAIVTKISDSIIDGPKFAKMVYIISDRTEDIARRILQEMERGASALHIRGMYTGKRKEMLFCVVGPREVPQLKDIIQETDPGAFVIVTDAKEVRGEGFLEEADFHIGDFIEQGARGKRRQTVVHAGVLFDHEVAARGDGFFQIFQIGFQRGRIVGAVVHPAHDAEGIRPRLADAGAPFVGRGQEHIEFDVDDFCNQTFLFFFNAHGTLLDKRLSLRKRLFADAQIIAVALDVLAFRAAAARIAGDGFLQHFRSFLPVIRGGQSRAEVAHGEGGFRVIAQNLAPYGEGGAVMGHAFFVAARFFVNTAEIVQTGGNLEAFRAALFFPQRLGLKVQLFGSVQMTSHVLPEGKGEQGGRHTRIVRRQMSAQQLQRPAPRFHALIEMPAGQFGAGKRRYGKR